MSNDNREHYELRAEHALHGGERFPACAEITGLIGSARPRHASFHCLDLFWRYVAELLFGGGDRCWSRLHIHGGRRPFFRGRPAGGLGFELGVNAACMASI